VATTEYTTLALLKEALKITDTDRDNLLNQAVSAASRGIDDHCGRRFYLDDTASARTYNPRRRIVRERDGDKLLVDDIGNVDDLLVEVGRGSTWTDITADIETEPENALTKGEPVTALLRFSGCWPIFRDQRVRVTAQWGWPAVPDVVAQAALIQAQRLFKRKDSPEGILGSAEWGVVRLSRIDPDVQSLIANLVLPGVG
jgi:gp6-like head-tail connector protein